MVAFVLTVILFAYWMAVGLALLRRALPHRDGLWRDLLAPAVGVATMLVPLFWLSRGGWPLGRVALPVVLGEAVVAGLSLSRGPGPRLTPGYGRFALALLGALAATGWPLAWYGSDWLSVVNDDMTNYALLAQHYLHHGYLYVPNAADLLSGRHYEQTFWLQGLVERVGGEMLLAGVAAVSRQATVACFMALIVALHLVVVSAAGALVLLRQRQATRAALLAMTGLAAAPLLTLGTVYQLLGQTLGLGLLLACVNTAGALELDGSWQRRLGWAAVTGLVLAASLIAYPELLPFAAAILAAMLTMAAWHGRRRLACSWRWSVRRLLTSGLAVAAVVALGLQGYLWGAADFLQRQATRGVSEAGQGGGVFQGFLRPSQLAGVWGLLDVYALPAEPWLSVAIGAGAILLLVTTALSLRLGWRGEPAALGMLTTLGAAALLGSAGASFGVYKVSMYAQPFLWSALALGLAPWLARPRQTWMTLAGALPLLAVCLHTQWGYVSASTGQSRGPGGPFCEVPQATGKGLFSHLQAQAAAAAGLSLVADAQNLVLAKLQYLAFTGTRLTFPFRQMLPGKTRLLRLAQHTDLEPAQERLRQAAADQCDTLAFALADPDEPAATSLFWVERGAQPVGADTARWGLLASTAQQSPFNRRQLPQTDLGTVLMPWSGARDHLMFVDSSRGQLYFCHRPEVTGLYQLEPDFFYPGHTMAGVGRLLLFQVVNPSAAPRLVMSMTASLKGDGDNALPVATAIGQERGSFGVTGRGSARVASPPLVPQAIGGRLYVAVDLAAAAVAWQRRATGLMRLFGTNAPADPRRLTAFLRDVSLVSATDYAQAPAPHQVHPFPAGLANPGLEYSGVYEDGWVSESSFFVLEPVGEGPAQLRLAGMLPNLGDAQFSCTVRLAVNGVERQVRQLTPGPFALASLEPAGGGKRRVDLRFSAVQQLPAGDGRPVAALLSELGFIANP